MTFTSDQDKAQSLNHSVLFDVHRWSDYPEINAAINHLFAILKHDALLSVQDKKGKKFLKIIVLDLLANWYRDHELYSAIYRKKSHYTDLKARYNKLFFKYDAMIKLLDALVELGFIEQYLGFYDSDNPRLSKTTRIKATPKLVDFLTQDYLIKEGMIERAPSTECIILRDKVDGKKTDLDYEDTSDTRAMRQNLYNYNNLLRDMFISIPEVHNVGIPTISGANTFVTQNEKFVRRIFNNNSWKEGGRYYGGWWQRIPKEWREKIRFWDMATVEVDYSGLHIVLLYAREGINYWKVKAVDPYAIEGIEQSERMRALLKTVLLTAINSRTKQEAIKAVNYHITNHFEDFCWVRNEGLSIGDLIDHFTEGHQAVSQYFFTSVGLRLQNCDAKIAEEVIKHFTEQGIPVLCMHDSFIIEAKNKAELKRVMNEAITRVKDEEALLDTNPKMKKKTIGLELSTQDIIKSTREWKQETITMKQLYKDYPAWVKVLEDFDDNKTSTDYLDNYYNQLMDISKSK